MAVQAEFGESASESGIRQVEVEPTAPISDVSTVTCYKVPCSDLIDFGHCKGTGQFASSVKSYGLCNSSSFYLDLNLFSTRYRNPTRHSTSIHSGFVSSVILEHSPRVKVIRN